MKKFYFLVLIFFYSFFYSQCDCAKNFGGHIDDSVLGIEKISDGFLYNFNNRWGDTEFPVAGQYIIKFDFNCNKVWQKYILNDTFTVDSYDNIYTYRMEGIYQDYTFKIRKYNPNGVLLWEKLILYKGPHATSLLGTIPWHLFVRNNKLYVAGVYRHDLNFEDKVIFHYDFSHFGGNRAKAFVANYTTDGDFIDAKEFGDGKIECIQNFEADNYGNIYVTYGDRNFGYYKIHKIDSNLKDVLVKTFTNSQNYMRVPTILHFNKYNSKLYSYDVSGPRNLINNNAIITEYDPDKLEITKFLNFNNNSALGIPNDEGNTAPLFLNKIYFAEESNNEMFLFGHFQKFLNLNGVQLNGHVDQYGRYGNDLVFFKLDTNTFVPEFIFQSTSTDLFSSLNVAMGIIMDKTRVYLAGNMGYKKMILNGISINNNSGNGDADAFLFRYDVNSTIGTLQSNSPVCIGKDIELTSSGGTAYSWTGPNGFSSNLQNPIIPNSSTINSGTYTCKVTGSGSCDGTFNIDVIVGDILKPIPDATTLPKITGDCKTTITIIPTATDNCKGQIFGTTTDPLSYQLPGNYTITWKYDDGNGNIATQTQQVEITTQPLPTWDSSQVFCKINKPKISDITVTANNPKWYDASGNLITNLSQELIDNTKYYVSQTSSGCESAQTEILIKLADPIPPIGNTLQDFCSASNPTLKDVVVTGTVINWYNNLGNLLPETTALQNGETYYATQTINGCESTQKLAVKVNVVTNYLSANDFTDSFCNDTTADFKTINIDNYRKELIANPQDYSFEIRNSKGGLETGDIILNIGTNIFDVKIISSLGCFQFVKLSLTLNEKPKVILPADAEFCDNVGTPLKVDFVSGYSYLWNTGETSNSIIADKEQTYSVTVTTLAGCTNTGSTIVKKAKLAEIQNILITNNSAMIIMSFAGDYLYSLDQIDWKSSNKFENLKNGNYTVFVKTKLGCNLGSKSFTIFSLSNIFSPNGDGINDTWKISGIENYPNSEIKIFDKQGKMVVNQITKGEAFEWNGESNGRKLPTDSYWYQIKLSDGRILDGYVVIKNRN